MNLPAIGGAGGGVPSSNEVRTGGRSNVAEGRANACVGAAAGVELHAARNRQRMTKSARMRNIVAGTACGAKSSIAHVKFQVGKVTGLNIILVYLKAGSEKI